MMAPSFLTLSTTEALGKIYDKTFHPLDKRHTGLVIHKEEKGREPTTVPAHSQRSLWTWGQGEMGGEIPREKAKGSESRRVKGGVRR